MIMHTETTRKATTLEMVDELKERIVELQKKEKKADLDWSWSAFFAGIFVTGFIWFIVVIITHGH